MANLRRDKIEAAENLASLNDELELVCRDRIDLDGDVYHSVLHASFKMNEVSHLLPQFTPDSTEDFF